VPLTYVSAMCRLEETSTLPARTDQPVAEDDTTPAHALSLHEAALEGLPTPILIHDHHCVLYANRAALDVLGAQTHIEVVGRAVSDIVHPDGAEAGATRRAMVMERGHVVTNIPLKLVGVDGVVRYVVATGQPIEHSDGQRAVLVTAVLVRVGDDGARVTPPA